MKTKTLLLSLSLLAGTAMAQGLAGIDKNNLDPTVKPGNDFYRYAAGGWLKSHPLDAEHTSNGSFVDLSEACQKQIQELILEAAQKEKTKGSLGQKIGRPSSLHSTKLPPSKTVVTTRWLQPS